MFYWFLFFIPVRLFYIYRKSGKLITNKIWKIISIFLTLIIGLRENVGGDWIPYKEGIERISSGNFEEIIFEKYEIGFNYLSWISVNMGLGVYGVNFICAVIFVHGLIKLCKEQPYPWLALVASVPYLIIVVAMGYTRQATAIGLLMFGFGYLLKGRSILYLLLVILATSFHKPAFLFVSFIFLQPASGYIKLAFGTILLFLLSGSVLFMTQADTYYVHYVEENMESSGGQIRVLMNILPTLILLYYWNVWGRLYKDRWFWAYMSLISISFVVLVSVASTAVDRMALYLIPFQIVAFSRLPLMVQQSKMKRVSTLIIIYYSLVLFVWLYFGRFSSCFWIPYDNLLFPPIPFVRDVSKCFI